MVKNFYNNLKKNFEGLEKKTLKIMKAGLKFSFATAIIAAGILITYIYFVHSYLVFKIGLLIFELALSFAADFIISGIAVDSIKKQII